jgi:hypothetical protein
MEKDLAILRDRIATLIHEKEDLDLQLALTRD